jgi:hypothetical protein
MSSRTAEAEDEPSEELVRKAHCGGGGVLGEAGTIHSPLFEQEFLIPRRGVRGISMELITSTLHLTDSPAIAARNISAVRTFSVQECMGRYLDSAYGAGGPLIREHLVVSPLPAILPETQRSFGFSLDNHREYLPAAPGSPRSHERAMDIAEDILGFAYGRAEITLLDTHQADRPDRPRERRLLRLLYGRARASKL